MPPTLQDVFGDDLEDMESLPEIIEIEAKRSREDEDTPPPPTPKRSRVDLSLLSPTPLDFDLLLTPTPVTEVDELLSASSTPLLPPPSPMRHMPILSSEDVEFNLSPPTSPLPPRTPPGMESLTSDDFFDLGKLNFK